MAAQNSSTTYGTKGRRILASNPAATPVDGVYNSNTPAGVQSLIDTGELSAENCGAFNDGSDCTAALNAAFALANVKSISFNNPRGGAYNILGTVTIPAGKHIRFKGGCYLSGGGTLNGGIIDASYRAQIFAAPISFPGVPTLNPAATGGTLAAATYYYVITALNANGQTIGSVEASATTTGATSSIVVNWPAVTGATSYRIYRGTATGAENLYYTSATNSFTDTGSASTAGTPPTADTTTVTVNPEALVGGKWSVRWFGAVADNASDDQPAIQKTIDTAIASFIRRVYLPKGTYFVSKGILIRRGTNQFTDGFQLEGDVVAYGGNTSQTTIRSANANSFVVGVHKGKGVRIRNIFVSGPNTAIQNLSFYDVWENPAADFVQGNRNVTNSPQCGFIVDPFDNTAGLAVASMYPDFQQYYNIGEGNGGSTDIVFENCVSRYHVVGFCMTPHGGPQNGDAIVINNCWSDYCKAAISVGQSQNRSLLVNNFKCWGWVETVFDCQNYSNGTADNPEVDGLNVAGAVRYLCRLSGYANKGLTIKRGHIESLYMFGGNFKGQNKGDLILTDTWVQMQPNAAYNVYGPFTIHDAHTTFFGGAFKVTDCYISKYSGYNVPLKFNARSVSFTRTQMDLLPVNIDTGGTLKIDNCTGAGSDFNFGTFDQNMMQGPAQLNGQALLFLSGMVWGMPQRGNRSVPVGGIISTYRKRKPRISLTGGYVFGQEWHLIPLNTSIAATNINANALTCDFVIGAGLDAYKKVATGDYIYSTGITDEFGTANQFVLMGQVTGKTDATGTISLSYTAKGLAAATNYALFIARQPKILPCLILGDCTNGSNVVANVLAEQGAIPSIPAGTAVNSPYFPEGTYVVSTTSTTITLSNNATATASGIEILNADWEGVEYGVLNTASIDNQGYKRGDIIFNTDFVNFPNVYKWTCITSGICNTTRLPVFKVEPLIPDYVSDLQIAAQNIQAKINGTWVNKITPPFKQNTGAPTVQAGSLGTGVLSATIQPGASDNDFSLQVVTTGTSAGSPAASNTTQLSAPGTPVLTPSATGGTLAAGTYFYKVTALNAAGETTASVEASAAVSGTTSSIAISWPAVTGAASYRIYRGTATGAENVYYTSATNSYTDTNAASTAGSPPASNTTALATPATPTLTPSSSGGYLQAGTYYYKIAALNAVGETLASAEANATVTGTVASIGLSWAAVAGATSYRIYRGTATGAENVYYTSATNSYTDTNAANVKGTICFISFNSAWSATPVVVFSASDVNTGNNSSNMWGGASAATQITFGGTITPSGTYNFNFHVAN